MTPDPFGTTGAREHVRGIIAAVIVVCALFAGGCSASADHPAPAASSTAAGQRDAASPATTATSAPTDPVDGPAADRADSAAAPGSDQSTADTRALLDTIPVKGRAPKTGYNRDEFGTAWTDDVTVDGGHNGCDTRNDVLRRDLTGIAYKPGSHGCTVLTGVLPDPYTGRSIDFTRGKGSSRAVQIDHVVAFISDHRLLGATI